MNINLSDPDILHTPFEKEDPYHALSMPVYHSVAFEFETAEAMEAAFCGRSSDHTYSRITNPTVQYFEKKITQATGAISVTALSSGMAAISNTFLTIAWKGANIVTSSHLFGNTYSFLTNTLAAFGVEVRFCDLTSIDKVKEQIDGNTCAVFLEVITNPQMEVADLTALSALTRQLKIPLVADTTIVPFTAWKAKNYGIDIELISTTKYISGGATSLGGLIIDYGTFDWSSSVKLGKLAGTDSHKAFTVKLRKEIHRNLGAYMSPQVAYIQTLGLDTLDLRFKRQSATCLELAEQLRNVKGISSVNYPGLPDNPFFGISKTQFGNFPGAMFTFDLASKQACFAFMNRLKLIRRATNLFDNKTLAIHPGSTIYGSFTEEQRKSMDIKQTTIRLSVGLEDTDHLLRDIKQALA